MSFLNPGLLYGLVGLAIPFIVLLLFRKKIELQWAAYEWMAKASVKKHKQNLLDDILKLLAKLLLLLLLVLLMARPTLPGSGGGRRLVVIDTTPSMATVMDNGTRLSQAKQMAKQFLEQAKGSTAIAAYDGTLTPLAPLSDAPDPSMVDTASLTGKSGNFEQFVKSLLELENLASIPEVIFYTDTQRSDFADPAAVNRMLAPLSPTRIILIPVDTRETVVNLGITQMDPPEEGYLPDRANTLRVTVRNFSDQPADAVPVMAMVGDRLQDRVTLTLPPGAEQTVDLLVKTDPGDAEKIRVELPPDLYPPDDTWRLVADPPKRLRILAVAPPPGEDPFEYDVFFESALKAYVPEEHLVYQRVRPPQLLSLRLRNYDVVVTFGLPLNADSALGEMLSTYVEEGGSLLSFIKPGAAGSWQDLRWAEVPEEQETTVPDPDRLAGGVLDYMTAPGFEPSRIRFLRHTTFQNEPRADGDSKQTDREELHERSTGGLLGGLLYAEDQADPLIVWTKRGRGRMVLAGFLPYTGYTDLVYNPNFVQIGMRLLRRCLPETGIHSYTGRDLERLTLPSIEPDTSYSLRYGDHPSYSLDVRQPEGGTPFLSGEVLPENTFAVVMREDETLFELGYNLTRVDSDIRSSSPVDLEPFLSETLSVQINSEETKSRGGLEYTRAMAFLLLLGIAFDTYAHLWRRT